MFLQHKSPNEVPKMTAIQKDEFLSDVISCFSKKEYTVNGVQVEGASISDLKNSLSSNLRGSHHTDSTLEQSRKFI